jgi:hypothetical protein
MRQTPSEGKTLPPPNAGASERAHRAELREQLSEHMDGCRQRIPAFVEATFSWSGALQQSGQAWGTDILVAPYNFLMGFPNFLLQLLAVLVEVFGARKSARWLRHRHLGLPTRVQRTLTAKLMADLLDIPPQPPGFLDPVRHLVATAAREPVRIYVQTRNVAADLTAGALAVGAGLALFHQLTPGSISFGSQIAQVVAREEAVSTFVLGDTLGRLYYGLFPVSPSPGIIVLALLLIMAATAVVAAFSGVIHDPIQTVTGIHRRRLNRLLDAIEASLGQGGGDGYRPKDTFFGRVYDLVDWIKGVLSL